MLSCDDVADYFLALVDSDAGDLMSNLKLQKLAYYAQGLNLALYGQPLFGEPIEAWVHGPVVPKLYHRFKQFASGAIPEPSALDLKKFTADQQELLNEVFQVYGQFSALKLRNMTHEEPPWKDTPQGQVIPHSALRDFFKTRLAETV